MHNTIYLTRVRNDAQPFLLSAPNIGNFKIFLFVGLFLSALLVTFCIFQINTYTKAYYSIQSAQSQIDQLTKENRNLQISFSNTNSLNNINEHIKGFEAINKIEYIKILDRTVLAK